MHVRIKIGFTLLINLFIINQVFSQVVYSPYSLFGIGRIENSGYGVNSALGGTGIALQSGNYLNTVNPASFDGIDSLRYISDIGFFFNNTTFTSKDESQVRNDGNIEYFALGFRVSPLWAMSFGITPISRIDYIINSESHLTGELSAYDMTYTGSGGVNKFFIGNSFSLLKNLVLGVNVSGIFGNVTLLEKSLIGDDQLDYTVESANSMNGLYLDFGLQYGFKIKENEIRLGAIYGYRKELSTTADLNVTYLGDELNVEDYEEVDPYEIPRKIGVGLAFKRKERWEIGVDYEKQYWGDYELTNPLARSRNSERFSMGIEFFPQKKSDNKGFKNWTFRFGGNYKKSSIVVSSIPINSFGLAAGIGIPLKNKLSILNMSFEYGQNGTLERSLIEESFWQVNFSLSFQDIWFQRRKY